MSLQNVHDMSFSLIQKELGLDASDNGEISDEEMVSIIAERVEAMIDKDPGLLMSYLYRLDVSEKKAKNALEQEKVPVSFAVAELIWSRQKKRMQTKKEYSVKKENFPDELQW